MYRAIVVSVDDDGAPYVEVPGLGRGYEFGPCPATAPGPWVVGDDVLVESVDEVLEDLVIVGRVDPEPGEGGGGDPDPTPTPVYERTFTVPTTEWLAPHGLGRLRPDVVTTDLDDEVLYGDVEYDSTNQLRVIFAFPTTGTVTVSL